MEEQGTSIFDMLVIGGAMLSVLGLIGLIWCILRVAKAKRAGLKDDDLRAAVQAVVPLNLGALLISALGLMCVVIGVLLG